MERVQTRRDEWGEEHSGGDRRETDEKPPLRSALGPVKCTRSAALAASSPSSQRAQQAAAIVSDKKEELRTIELHDHAIAQTGCEGAKRASARPGSFQSSRMFRFAWLVQLASKGSSSSKTGALLTTEKKNSSLLLHVSALLKTPCTRTEPHPLRARTRAAGERMQREGETKPAPSIYFLPTLVFTKP